MVEIKYIKSGEKPGKNSRARCKARRKQRRMAIAIEKQKEKELEKKIKEIISGCDNKILKAIELPNPNYRDETEIHQKADAMHKVVNHAHQRNPKKKW